MIPRITIMVNLLHAQETLTGTGYYAKYLIEEMLKLPNAPNIVGITSKENHQSFKIEDDPSNYKRVIWGRPWNKVALKRLEEWLFLRGFIRRHMPAVFWGPSNFSPLTKPCPLAVTIHDMTFFDNPEALPPLRRKYWHAWTKRTMAVAHQLMTVSNAAREDIIRHFPMDQHQIEVVPNGTGKQFYLGRDTDGKEARERQLRKTYPDLPEKYVFFLGTLAAHKNVPRLIESLAEAREDGCEDMHLVMAGKPGNGYEEVKRAIEKNNLETCVHELGYVGDEHLPSLYEAAHVHILPSYSEGFGMPITEAMAAGTPVVTSNVGAMAEVAGKAGLLADPNVTSEFAAHLKSLWKTEALWEEKRATGLSRADEYTWESSAEKTFHILQRTAFCAPHPTRDKG